MKCTLLKGIAGKCDWCAKELTGRRRRWCSDPCSKKFYLNHRYSDARRAAKRRDHYRCVKCGSKDTLEVNHIEPCNGKHSKFGCWHHLENLETLCHQCHVVVTNEQRADGQFRKARRKTKRPGRKRSSK